MVKGAARPVHGVVSEPKPVITTKLDLHIEQVCNVVGVLKGEAPTKHARRFETKHPTGHQFSHRRQRGEVGFRWGARGPGEVTALVGCRRQGVTCGVRPFKQEVDRLVVGVHGVVDTGVKVPTVAFVVDVQGRFGILVALGEAVCGAAVGPIVDGLDPLVEGHRVLREAPHIVERQRHRSLTGFVDVGAIDRFGRHQGGGYPVQDEREGFQLILQRPVFSGPHFKGQCHVSCDRLGQVQHRIPCGASCWEHEPVRGAVFPDAFTRRAFAVGEDIGVDSCLDRAPHQGQATVGKAVLKSNGQFRIAWQHLACFHLRSAHAGSVRRHVKDDDLDLSVQADQVFMNVRHVACRLGLNHEAQVLAWQRTGEGERPGDGLTRGRHGTQHGRHVVFKNQSVVVRDVQRLCAGVPRHPGPFRRAVGSAKRVLGSQAEDIIAGGGGCMVVGGDVDRR